MKKNKLFYSIAGDANFCFSSFSYIVNPIWRKIKHVFISGCNHLHESDRIPIVFAGETAEGSNIANIRVIDAPVAVAMYGGSSVYGRYTPFIDGNRVNVSSIEMDYTSKYSNSWPLRHNTAVFGKTSGTMYKQYCQ